MWAGWPRELSKTEVALAPGEIKLEYLQREIPASANYAGLYAVSSTSRRSWDITFPLVRLAGVKIVWNQNGLYYPAWGAANWRLLNARLGYFITLANGIIYQSQFCRRAVEQLVPGKIFRESKPSLVLLNPVDVDNFTPTPEGGQTSAPTILSRMANERSRRYRNILAFEAMKTVWEVDPRIKLHFIGAKQGEERNLIEGMFAVWHKAAKVPPNALIFSGSYSRQEAPAVMRQGTICLHTAYCDPCPNIVAEALATGLPVIYLSNGGTPELVGNGGIGVPCPENLYSMELPAPGRLAEAILKAIGQHAFLARHARQEACSKLSISAYADQTSSFLKELKIT